MLSLISTDNLQNKINIPLPFHLILPLLSSPSLPCPLLPLPLSSFACQFSVFILPVYCMPVGPITDQTTKLFLLVLVDILNVN